MMKPEFLAFVRKLCKHYGKRDEPDVETMDLWFEVVQAVPGEALEKISLDIRSEHDFFPRNLAKAVRDAWSARQEDGRADSEEDRAPAVRCEECGGSGYLWAWRDETGRNGQPLGRVRYCFRCGHCKRYAQAMHGMPMATWPMLERQHYSRHEGCAA